VAERICRRAGECIGPCVGLLEGLETRLRTQEAPALVEETLLQLAAGRYAVRNHQILMMVDTPLIAADFGF